ncbi:MAG: glycosyltransferase [Planctomycetota bacterium]
MRKIRLLHIIEQLGVGGCETQLLKLCKRFDKSRFDLAVCWYAVRPDCQHEKFADAGAKTIFLEKKSMPAWRFFRKLRRIVKEASPDIVHTWMYSANFWGRWAAVTNRIPHIVASNRVEARSSHIIDRVYERLLINKTLRLANSKAVAESLEYYYGVPVERTKIIYNAVELAPCDRKAARSEIRQELGLPENQKLVLMVARLWPQKNWPMFVRSGAQVCKQRSDVTFIGAGYGPMQDKLETLIDELGMKERVRLVGLRNDIHRWYAAADVFCLTSDYEGFPNVVLEAMHTGLPVVCTSFNGADEVINHPHVGKIVPLDDHNAMAQQINMLLDDSARCQSLGNNAKSRAQRHFSWDVLVHTMESLYEGLIQQNEH